ncbi:MAG: 2-C-methyl-D-erythritol 4-phosphate cytidylyltransferase [bacterium]
MIVGIIVAAGKSERMGADIDKVFLSLGTKPVLAYSLLAFEQCPLIDGVILVVRKDRLDSARGLVQMLFRSPESDCRGRLATGLGDERIGRTRR